LYQLREGCGQGDGLMIKLISNEASLKGTFTKEVLRLFPNITSFKGNKLERV